LQPFSTPKIIKTNSFMPGKIIQIEASTSEKWKRRQINTRPREP
jgi:hypothetical protein